MERGSLIVGKGEVIGVAVHALAGEAMDLTYVHLHRRRDGVHVRAQGRATDIGSLVLAVGTRVPVALVVDTDRCVHRVVQHTGEPDELLRQAFPNASLSDLCTSVWQAGPATGLSMARRTLVKDLLDRFTAARLRAVQVSIGPWGLLQLRASIAGDETSWTLGGHRFGFSDDRLTTHAQAGTPEEETFTIGDDTLPARHALAFACAWGYLVPAGERHDGALPEVAAAQREERARLHYERGLVLLGLLLAVLVGGERLITHHLDRSQALLKTSASAHSRDLEALKVLRQQVQDLEAISDALGAGSNRRLARQAAELAATVPTGIRLDRLTEDPLRAPLKEHEPLVTEQGLVRMAGTCRDAATLDAWIGTVQGTSGLSSVELRSYTIDPETGTPRFELELAP